MSIELQKGVKLRLEQVSNRLVALEAERISLQTEQEHLKELKVLYDKIEYDPITEERRVTEMLCRPVVEPPKPKRQIKGDGRKPTEATLMLKEILRLIFEDNGNAQMKTKDLKRKVYELDPDLQIPEQDFSSALWRGGRAGWLYSSEKGWWKWNEKK
jgi:hypothetical protein